MKNIIRKFINIKHKQSGFLSLMAVMLISIVSIAGLGVSYQFVNSSNSSSRSLFYVQSYYLAASGVEYSKYQLIKKGVNCSGLTGSNMTFTSAKGNFKNTAVLNSAANILNGSVGKTNSSITLNSANNFASSGMIAVDNEVMLYNGKSGNTLNNVKRGQAGTLAANHASNSAVAQNQCSIVSNAGVPNLTSPLAKATLQTTIFSQGFPTQTSSAQTLPSVTSVGTVYISGTTSVINSAVTPQSTAFTGSTILTGGLAFISDNAATYVNSSNGTLVVSSNEDTFGNDIVYNDTADVNSGSVWGLFFSADKPTVQSRSTIYNNANQLDGITGEMAWVNKCLTLTGTNTIGSAAAPVVLIINGSLMISGQTTIYGLVYVIGSVVVTGGGSINGALVSERGVSIDDSTVSYNQGILTALGITYNDSLNTRFSYLTSGIIVPGN